MTSRDYGDINHAIGFNHIGDQVIAFCCCGFLAEPLHSPKAAQMAGEIHLGEVV